MRKKSSIKRYGIKWTEGPARAPKTGKLQGQDIMVQEHDMVIPWNKRI